MIKLLISGLQSPEMKLFDHMTFSSEDVDNNFVILHNVMKWFFVRSDKLS
jgi:hypothetical protein